MTAYDAETGDQAWRFHIVPGDPSQPFESNWRWRQDLGHGDGGGGNLGHFSRSRRQLLYIGTGNGAIITAHKGTHNLFLNASSP